MGIFTPKLNSVPKLNSTKLNFLQTIAVVFLFIGITAFSVSEKNLINVSVLEPVATRTVLNTQTCNSNADYAFYLDINGVDPKFEATNGTFIEYDDGTATLDMHVVNVNNNNLRFDVSVNYAGRTFSAPTNSPKENICSTINTSDWYYYTSTNGTAIGTQGYSGARLSFIRLGPAMQLGYGANVTDQTGNFGASGWLDITVQTQSSNNYIDFDVVNGSQQGDININLSGNPLSPCINVTAGGEIAGPDPVCFSFNDPGLITSLSLPSGGSGELEYIWLKSTSGCDQSTATVINGANSATFNPGPITQTTWFRRCSRRAGCTSFDFGESNCVRIDYQESCGEPAPTGWTLNCEDDQSVEIIGEGIRCQNSYTLNIPNANDVVQVVAEVVYKGQSANPSQLMIKTNNETAFVPAEFTNPARAYFFRTTFGPANQVVLENIPNACQAQSLILYVFREGGQTTASTGQFVQTWIYHDTHCETLVIPTAPATRNVEIEVPLSEITTDGRIAIVRAEVVDNPAINAEVIINDVNQGDALYIAKLVLEGVAPLEDEIEICVESPFETATTPNGQSLVYSGAVKANPECKTCDDSDIALSAEVISNYNGSQISCTGANDGRLQALISGGVPPFTYEWSNGTAGQIVSDIAPGTYVVTVTDRFGCSAVAASVSIDEPQPITAEIELTEDYSGSPISCNGANDAAIQVVANGGTAPYVYQWGANGNFLNTEALSNLAPGTYEVQVSDANGCITNASITLEEPEEFTAGEIDVVANYNGTFISCAGAEDGILNISATGGTAPYSYSWSNGATTATIENLGPGTYTVSVEDGNGCAFERTVTIDEPAPLTLDLTITTDYNGFNISCFGENDGAITSSATGGTGSLTYTWSNGTSGINIDELAAGTYSLVVVDENDCSIEKSVTLTEPSELEIEAMVISDYSGAAISCAGANDARAQVIITGAIAPYTISWSNGENTQIISDLAPGTYTVTVADANGCELTTDLQIAEPEGLTCNATIISNYFEGVTISSQGGNDGAAEILVNGGTGNITYQWSNGSTTSSITGLSAGTYEVIVADENGCNCSTSVTLEDPAKVGDQVWIDLNGNGILDAGETGLANVELILTGTANNGTIITRTITTDSNGNYTFDGLLPGVYKITLDIPTDYILTATNIGGNDNLDSDFDPTTLMSPVFTLNAGDENDTVDAGLYQSGKIGDYVWIDINKNGIQDADELPLGGVEVTLTGTDGLGQTINLTTVTDANGFYEFTNLLPGNYKLTFVFPSTPVGLEFTQRNAGDDALDSDVDPATGMTDVLVLNSGEDRKDIDAGFIDAQNPIFIGIPLDTTVICAEVPAAPELYVDILVEDNLGQNIIINFTESSTQSSGNDCGAYNYEIVRTWEATDDSGNSLEVTQTITVIDESAPSISGVPADLTIDCAEVPAPIDPEVMDDCDQEFDLVFSEIRIDGTCASEYTLIRTWTATDACGNSSFEEQKITVEDNNLPVLIGVPADVTVSCENIPAAVNVEAEDNCSLDLDVVFGEIVAQGSCANSYEITRTWTVVDECGNQEVGIQKIKVEDNQEPVLNGVPADVNLSCEAYQGYQNPVVTATDNCTDNIVVDILEETVSQSCSNTFTLKLTWTATDECGNSTSETQTINVFDETDPELMGVPADVVLSCQEYADYSFANVTAEDNCSVGLDVVLTEEVISQTCENTFELKLTWTATDACGNSTSESQLISVSDESVPELIGVPADLNVSCDQYSGYDANAVTAIDNCTDGIQVEFLEEVISQTCENTFELKLTWTATDACGNSTSESQLITVTDDSAPELIGVPADLNLSCNQYSGYDADVVTATDNCTDGIQVVFLEEVISQTCENTFELKLTWTATDACGNSTSESQIITVTDDSAPELIGVPADLNVSCDQYSGYDADVVTATDNCTDGIQVVFLEEVISQTCENTFELKLTWTATDACGNSTSETQLITVTDDSAPELIGVPADLNVSCDQYTGYDVDVVTATDNCTDGIQVAFLEEVISQTCENTFELKLTWTATDACGNSTSETQLITVTDEVAPELIGVPADVTLACEDYTGYDADIVTATDNCTDGIQVAFLEEVISQTCANTFELRLTWTATDACGNSTSESQSITVSDEQRPQLFGVPSDITVSCADYAGYDADIVTATDNCTDNIQVAFLEETLESTCANGFVLRLTWTATDECGNSSTNNQEITVVDDVAPEILGVPTDAQVDCNNVPDAPVVGIDITATDNCTANIDVDFLETITAGSCANEYVINRTWTATDECGNQTIEKQQLFVSDEQDPTLIGVPGDLNISCGELPVSIPTVLAEDNCSDGLTVDFLENIIDGDCEFSYTIVRTWTTTDECGNTTTEEQRIEVGDDLDPVLESAPADVTVACDDIPSAVTLMATDDCGGSFEAAFLESIQAGNCDFNYIIVRTWTATDACGNQTSETQEVTVVDEVAPVIIGVPANEYYTCGNDDNITMPTVTIEDNCDQNAALDFEETVVLGSCPNTYILTRTWTAIDACGNTSSATQTIEVSDNVDPELWGVPTDISVACGAVPDPVIVTATDGCQDVVNVQYLELSTPGTCVGTYTITRTWTATDNCGNQSSESQVIEVIDNEAPTLSPTPGDITVNLSNGEQVPAVANVIAIDDCDTQPGLDFEETEEPIGNCGNTILRTWSTRDNCGNVASYTQTITVLNELSASLNPVQVSICAGEEFEFNVVAQGTGFSYSWDVNGGTVVPDNETAIFSAQTAGTYVIQVMITDDSGCEATLKSQIIVADPNNTSAGSNSPICESGNIELFAEGGSSYEWTGPNGFSSAEQQPEIANVTTDDSGDYIVTISNGACTATEVVSVIVGEKLVVDYSVFPVECGSFGSITVGSNGGTGTITYDWADLPGSDNPATRDDLVPGSYDVIVSDEIGCSVELNDLVIIDACQCDAFAGTLDQENDEACLNQGVATLEASANGDAVIPTGYETIFVLTSGADLIIVDVDDAPFFSVTEEGSYTIHTLVYDPSTLDLSIVELGQTTGFDVFNLLTQGAGTICGNIDVTGTTFEVTSPKADVISVSDENCGNEDGSASLAPADYDFVWSDGGTGAVRNDLVEGSYTVEATSPEGCNVSLSVTVGGSCICTEPLINDIIVFEAHCGFLDGSAEVIPVGNPANFSYTWSTNNGTTNGIGNKKSGLAPGIYEVIISNNNFADCKTKVSIVVGTIGGPEVEEILITDATCDAADGSVSFLPTEYTYVWEFDNFTGSSRSDLAAGKYQVIVLDGNVPPCADVVEVEVLSSSPLTLSAETIVAPDCDEANGEVEINVENGSGNYTFLWDDQFTQSESSRDELSQGIHTVLVTDNESGCEKELMFVLNNNVPSAALELLNIQNESCVGLNNGTVSFSYDVDPNFANPATTMIIDRNGEMVNENNLEPGDYFMLVEDVNGCIAGNLAFAIEQATELKVNIGIIDKTCDQEGRIEVDITGGTADYTFDWADLSGTDDIQNRLNIDEGTFELIISDAAGCNLRIAPIEVRNNCAVETCTDPVVSNIVVIESNCGASTGSIQIEMVDNNANYKYSIVPNVGSAAGNVFTNLPSGAYEITIEDGDDDQCSISQIVVVENADGPQANLIQSAPAQCGMNNGTAVMSPFNFIYEWCNGVTDFNPSNLPAGTCLVTITDPATGCSNIQEIEILEQNNLEATAQVIQSPDCGSSNGEVRINVLGGSGTYDYLWEDGIVAQERTDLSDGTYTVEITDQNTSCSLSFTFGLTGNVEGEIQIFVNDNLPLNTLCAGDNNIELDYTLIPSATFEGPAQIAIEDANGNTTDNGSLIAGNYTLLVSDINGCLANSLAFEVIDAPELVLDVAITAASCDEGGSILTIATGGQPSYTYNWEDLAGTNNDRNRTNLAPGSYNLEVTDENGCIVAIQDIAVFDECVDCGQPDFTAITLELNSDDQYCFDLEACFDPSQVSFVLADGTMNGSSNFGNWELGNDGCLTYNAQDEPGTNVDQICIIASDGVNSDTTCISFSIIEIPMGGNPTLDTIYVSTDIDVTLDSCLNIDEIGGVVTGSNTNANADNGIFFITAEECYRYIPNPGESGMFIDTVTVILCNNNIPVCDTTIIILSILPDQSSCDPFYTGPTDLLAEDCEEGAAVCLDFEVGDLFDYQILDNGADYNGAFDVCVIDTQYQYVAFQLGAPGAYTLDEWQANGQTFSLDLFTSPQQLADSMNVWDPTGNWEVFGFVIVGGNGGSNYSSLFISANSVPQFEVPNQIIPDATIVYLSEGPHNLIIQNMIDGCVQEIDFEITCVDPPVIVDTLINVLVGTIDTFCFDLAIVNSIENSCLDENDGNTAITLIPNSNCIAINGLLLGNDQYCLTACDTITGLCETINIEIAVLPVTDTIFEVINLGLTETLCLDTTIFQNAIDVFINDCENPFNSSVDFSLDLSTYCVEYTGDLIGIDTACLVVCDSLGFCETTVLIVEVLVPTPDTLTLPILVGTTDTFCLDGSQLSGPIQTVINICPQSVGENADIIIDPTTNCVFYTGSTVGQDTACFVICDANMVCDTTIVLFDVFNNLLPIAINDDTTTTIGNSVVIEVLLNDTINGSLENFEIIGGPQNGTVIINPDGTVTYTPDPNFCGGTDMFMYSISNEFGSDVATVTIEVLCEELIIFSGFSPNNDDVNDVFTILGIENFPNNQVCVFNRWGSQVHAEKGYRNDRGWEGTFNGKDLPDGTYFYVIEDGEGQTFSGYLQIHR